MADKKKKIIFIIASLEGFGGTNRVATLLANGLSPYYGITILSRFCIHNTYSLESRVKDVKFGGNNLSFLWQCKKYISTEQPNIVIVHTMSKLTPAMLLVGIRAKAIWSFEHTAYAFHKPVYKIFRKFFYCKLKLDKVIVLTESDKKHYQSIVKSVQLLSNPSPLIVSDYNYDKSSKTIISLGRLVYEKGYDLLIKAWAIVESCHPEWALHIYGEGKDKYKLEKIIVENKVKNLILKGFTGDIQSVYDNSAFYVMSSRFEGFGMVLVEAQSRGLPIVSFNCPSGPSEIVHHDIDGYLVENGNVLALAESIIKLIKDDVLRGRMSKRALDSAKAYQIDTIMEKWLYLIGKE